MSGAVLAPSFLSVSTSLFLLLSCFSRSSITSSPFSVHLHYQVRWSDTRQDWAQRSGETEKRERKQDRKEQQSNYLLLQLTSILPSFPFFFIYVTSFVPLFFPPFFKVLILWSVYCLVVCLLQFRLISFCFPWSVFPSFSIYPPFWISPQLSFFSAFFNPSLSLSYPSISFIFPHSCFYSQFF